jgi:hypothetical protein
MLIALAICSGCSGDKYPYQIVPFEGMITFKGEPLKDVMLEFTVGDFRTSSAAVGEGGRFRAVHGPGVFGVPVGTCTLRVRWALGESSPPPPEYTELFAKYGYGTEGFVFEITRPERDFRIDLE